ncbi:hypothetical protein OGAPHI_002970 [Ogataea philodendri]|uniref:Large ribosomal subunit protein bL32m n=1 Tax=Ogataea philodendri TaxID=1378263 RepID=A0A9P8T611_9ASCO|nr:uncharacterized protein OGAPHI_002970 [Ogataea philodendri]KAH3667321.1 hypothetical protein OGAPHI_002970 [Ogataea philodendri]
MSVVNYHPLANLAANLSARLLKSAALAQPESLWDRIRSQIPARLLPEFNDNGLVLAAPKKKTSHMKRRLRLYTPGSKQIKPNNNLNRCPSCGNYKRSHFLCMSCFFEIKQLWSEQTEKPPVYKEEFANPADERVLYPKTYERITDKRLRLKDYVEKRPKTLPVEK